MCEETNWAVNTQGPIKSKTNQFTTKEETSHPLANHDYGGRQWRHGVDVTAQQNDKWIRMKSDQFMEDRSELDFEHVLNQ